jgi:hypothetical protein
MNNNPITPSSNSLVNNSNDNDNSTHEINNKATNSTYKTISESSLFAHGVVASALFPSAYNIYKIHIKRMPLSARAFYGIGFVAATTLPAEILHQSILYLNKKIDEPPKEDFNAVKQADISKLSNTNKEFFED